MGPATNAEKGMYQKMIADATGCTAEDARLAEGWMRLERGCLDGLGTQAFRREALRALACVRADRKGSEQLARSYGL